MSLVPILAAGANIAMYISQLSVINVLRRAQKTETAVPVLQFMVSFLSSVLWLKYGLIKHDHTITFVNSLGTLIALYILGCFWWYAPKRSHIEVTFLCTSLSGLLMLLYVDHSTRPEAMHVFGLVCCVMSLVFLASPLGQMGSVIRKRDASVLLPSVAALAFCNNVLWSVYGHLHNDPFMLLPNCIGAGLCAMQLGLIALYGREAARLPVAVVGAVGGSGGVPMMQITPRDAAE
ncbi:Sugar transporter [Coemansia sp. Benny D115]|nr:Sugar transporter [Coemansia sp. Benny D115]